MPLSKWGRCIHTDPKLFITTTKGQKQMACYHVAAVAEIASLSASRKSLLFSIANASDLDGHWKLDRSRLQSMAGLSERAMRDNLRWLHRNGYLSDIGEGVLALTV